MERTFDTATPPRLDLRIPAGRIEVETAESAQTAIRLDGPDDLLERATVELRGGTVVVDVPDRRGVFFAGRDRDVRLAVRCPAGAALHARTKSADVAVRGELASADVATASGEVALERVRGEASLKSASGDLSVQRAGELSANTASGDVQVGVVLGAVRANLVSGDLRVDEAQADVNANSVSGDVEVRSVRHGTVRLQSVSSDVEVGVRRGSRLHVDASSLSGDTRSELELSGEPAGGDGPLVELLLKSVSGDLAVVRAPEAESQEVAR